MTSWKKPNFYIWDIKNHAQNLLDMNLKSVFCHYSKRYHHKHLIKNSFQLNLHKKSSIAARKFLKIRNFLPFPYDSNYRKRWKTSRKKLLLKRDFQGDFFPLQFLLSPGWIIAKSFRQNVFSLFRLNSTEKLL